MKKASEFIHYQVLCYILSPALFVQRDNSDSKVHWKDWKFNLPIRQKEGFASYTN